MFTSLDVKRLVAAANLPDYDDKNLLFPLLSAEERKQKIKTSDVKEEQEVAAAIEIQRQWRGYRARKILFSILCPSPSSLSYLSSNCSSPAFQEIRTSLTSSSPLFYNGNGSMSKCVSRIESNYHSYTESFRRREENEQKLLSFQGFCAWTIQKWWRKTIDVKKHVSNESNVISDVSDESCVSEKKRILTEFEAAIIIQKAWRRHIDVQVFQYYKQLINFRNKGDPQFMLKCINPKEADLLDVAAGIHLRFRMGGVKFPPNIYYKIFTHINVADVCAFSPRNYVDGSTKLLPGKFIHNKGMDIKDGDDDDDASVWYRRFENNGWRLVSDRVLKYMNHDPVVYETSKMKINFNHEKLVRKQDLELKKKRKKINWMKKMYSAGMMKARKGEEADIDDLVDAAAKGIFMITDQSGVQSVEDWEVDELLEWTNGLNYDSYLQDWQRCGTTSVQTDLKGNLAIKDPLVAMAEENS